MPKGIYKRKIGVVYGTQGKHHSEETKRKMSLSQMGENNPMYGKHPSIETRRKLSESGTGRKHSEESKQKIREFHIGRKHTDETKEKIRQIRIGKKHTEESKLKMRNNTNSIGYRHSEEAKQKMRNKIITEESKQKNRLAHLGMRHTEETKQKMREAHKDKTYKPMSSIGKKNISEACRGIKPTEKTKQKMRVSTLKRIQRQLNNGLPLTPCIGKHETEILDVLEETIGYTIFRQHRVVGYFLDGYCPNYNLAIEIDEPQHQNQREKDVIRENNIKNELNCEFVRITV